MEVLGVETALTIQTRIEVRFVKVTFGPCGDNLILSLKTQVVRIESGSLYIQRNRMDKSNSSHENKIARKTARCFNRVTTRQSRSKLNGNR
jgi:hypothetical protein